MNKWLWRIIYPPSPTSIAKWVVGQYRALVRKVLTIPEENIAKEIIDRRYKSCLAPSSFITAGEDWKIAVHSVLETCNAILKIETNKTSDNLLCKALRAIAENKEPILDHCISVIRLRAYYRIMTRQIIALRIDDHLAEAKSIMGSIHAENNIMSKLNALTESDILARKCRLMQACESLIASGLYNLPLPLFQSDEEISKYFEHFIAVCLEGEKQQWATPK